MNKPALSPVLATVCLAAMSFGTASAVETDLQLANTENNQFDLRLGAELVNKHYDQGVIRNENVTAVGHLDMRFWDIGLHADWYLAANGDDSQVDTINAGETTQINLGVDYLIEVPGLFQFIPHYEFITYPNWSERPYKSGQNWLGLDSWYLLPWQGVEVGVSFDYNPFYDGDKDAYRGNGGMSTHAFRSAIAARQFVQNAPLDIAFYEVVNFGNGAYKKFLIGSDETGLTTADIGLRYVAPFFLNDLWVVTRLEAHFWLENDDREALKAAGKETAEIIMGVGFEWKPE